MDETIDILVSAGYKTDDVDNPLQEIVFGAKVGSDGIPHPIIWRRNANTGDILEDYSSEWVS